jgi:RNA polymerase sigma-70 factor (ECF subfamily)
LSEGELLFPGAGPQIQVPGESDAGEVLISMVEMAQALHWGRDEAEAITELQSGSPAAFDALIRHYHAPLFHLLCQMLGNEADAADTTQEVFLKAFRGIRSFRRSSSLKTWLYRIAIRQALNHRRWWRRHQSKESSYDQREAEQGVAFEVAGTGPGPFEQLATREAQQAVRRALDRMPAVFRSAVILRDIEDLAYEEVAEILEVSVGTVKSRILRGRRALKELLEPELAGAPARQRGQPRGQQRGMLANELAGGER